MKKWLALFLFIIIIYGSFTMSNRLNFNNQYEEDLILTGDGYLVLSYHRIRDSSPLIKMFDKWVIFFTKDSELMLYSIYENEFIEQITYFLDKGYQFITPDELKKYLYNEIDIPKKSVLLTFDDVDISVYENAFPFLLEKQIPFTLFIITGEVGNSKFKGLNLASWNQIIEMNRSGLVTIGVHTHQMHKLDKENNPPFIYETNIVDFILDTQLTIKTVEEKLGISSTYYAYPYGFGMPKTDEVLLDLGYELIFTLKPGLVKQGDASFFIKRVLVSKFSWDNVVEWVEEND